MAFYRIDGEHRNKLFVYGVNSVARIESTPYKLYNIVMEFRGYFCKKGE